MSEYGLPSRSYYEQNSTVNEYQKVVASVLKAVMPTKAGRDNAAKLAADVVAFERAVVRLAPSRGEQSDVGVSYVTARAAGRQ